MKLELIKTPKGTYKILCRASKPNEALSHIAKLVGGANRYSTVKCGVYLIGDASFTNKVKVTSLCSNKSERMTKKQYHKFLKGEKQIAIKKINIEEKLVAVKNDDEWKQQEDELINGL